MIADLPFELLGDVVEGRQDVGRLGVRAERPSRDVQRGLDHLVAVRRTRMMLGDELELEPRDPRFQAGQACELVLGLLPELVGDRESAPGERQVQERSPPEAAGDGGACSRPADLVFDPTLACGGVRR